MLGAMRNALPVFLALVGVAVVSGLALRWWPRSFAAAMQELVDGDACGAAREACLRVVLDGGRTGLAGGDLGAGVAAAMAAISLGDEPGYRAILAQAAGRTPLLAGGAAAGAAEPAWIAAASFGEPHLRSLLNATLAESRGAHAAARAEYARAGRAARLAGAELAARLAEAGLARLPP
jgi:hypothetical protein